jgi:transmembrane sensor
MDLQQLLNDYRNNKMNAEQRAAFEQLLHSMEKEQQLQQLLHDSLQQVPPVTAEETQEYLFERIKEKYIKEKAAERSAGRVRFLTATWLRYAAAILIIVGVAAYFWMNKAKPEKALVNTNKPVQTDIAPGRDGAVLTLADGRQLVLDSLGNGIVATQNGAQVVLQNGSLAYDAGAQTTAEIVYNTMHTPKGRQFQLVLPDGTKVWLNAASSIKYPTVFTGDTRTVEIDGEAYFEVRPLAPKGGQKKMPFIVKIHTPSGDWGEVEVLGTHFNINAYEDEPDIKTTLLEGAVHVKSGGNAQSSAILKPGQQAVIAAHSPLTIDHSPDIDQVMAWKNGLFNFNGYDIKAVMREIGRWYDLDIVYEAEPEPEEMMGELQRNLSLSQVMKILQKIHVKYRVEGRKLIVMK